MSIDTTKKIKKFIIDGTEVEIAGNTEIIVNNPTAYSILTGDIAGTTITCYDNSDNTVVGTQTTPAITGGPLSFGPTKTGTYKLVAKRNDVQVWEKLVVVSNIGITFAGADLLSNYTKDQLSTICKYGYFTAMFEIGAEMTITDETSILKNYALIVEKVELVNGKNILHIRTKKPYTSASYKWNEYFAYLEKNTDTSFKTTYSSAGGYRTSYLRQTMLKQGDDVYIQATGLKPDGSSIALGLEFSNIYYTNTGAKSGVYTYHKESDTFTQDEEFTYLENSTVAQNNVKFIKGYFKSVGTIPEEVFNQYHYYVKSTVSSAPIYTLATEYSASTTYYGFYEKMQTDGVFYEALKSFKDYMTPCVDYSSAGLVNKTYLQITNDYIDVLAIEEMSGLNCDSIVPSGGGTVKGNSIGCYNAPGEGNLKPYYKEYKNIFSGSYEWSRSCYASSTSYSCCMYISGSFNFNSVSCAHYARPGFRFTSKN